MKDRIYNKIKLKVRKLTKKKQTCLKIYLTVIGSIWYILVGVSDN